MSNPNMGNASPKLGSDPDPPTSPNQQQSLVPRQPDFAHTLLNFPPPNQSHLAHRQPAFAPSQPNLSLNQPNFARFHQPAFARNSQPNFPTHNQQQQQQQPNLAHRQPAFAHRQPNFPSNQPNRPSPPGLPPHGQQQHFSPANQIVLRGHPPSLDQPQISTPSLPAHFFPSSTNPSYFPASTYQSFSPSSHPRFFAQAGRPAHSNHPHLPNQHQHQQQQQQQQHSRTSSQDSLLTCNPAPFMRLAHTIPAGANRRVTISTSAADAARRQEGMQANFPPANDDGPSSSNGGAREIHNAIRQVHETLNVMRSEMVAMHEQVHQNIYTLHHETHAMHGRNNGSIERVIKMLNYSERNNLARTMNSTITSQSQLLEPLLTSDGVRPMDFPVDIMTLNNLDIHQVTALCELYSLGLTGGMDQKMQRLRMFIGIERA